MKVLERWREFEDDPRFRSILEDGELLGLSKELFGKPPAAVRHDTAGPG